MPQSVGSSRVVHLRLINPRFERDPVLKKAISPRGKKFGRNRRPEVFHGVKSLALHIRKFGMVFGGRG